MSICVPIVGGSMEVADAERAFCGVDVGTCGSVAYVDEAIVGSCA